MYTATDWRDTKRRGFLFHAEAIFLSSFVLCVCYITPLVDELALLVSTKKVKSHLSLVRQKISKCTTFVILPLLIPSLFKYK